MRLLGVKSWGANALWLKNLRRNLPYALKMNVGGHDKNVFYFVIAPHIKHPGLADRMKAIVDCYNIAKMNGYQFRIVFKIPFHLEDYLLPHEVEWVADYADLHYSLRGTKFFNELNFVKEDSWKGRTTLKKNKEYHCYSYVAIDNRRCSLSRGMNGASCMQNCSAHRLACKLPSMPVGLRSVAMWLFICDLSMP